MSESEQKTQETAPEMETQQTTETPETAISGDNVAEQTEQKEQKEVKKVDENALKLKQELEETKRKLKEFKKLEEQRLESKLIEEKRFEELYKAEKERAERAEIKANNIKDDFVNTLKYNAIKEEATKLGMKEKYLKFLNLDTNLVEIETTDRGNVNVLGAREYLEDFKIENEDLFSTKKSPTINTNFSTTESKGKDLSAKEIVELQKKDPEKYRMYMRKRLQII